jgi:hypothetical protein
MATDSLQISKALEATLTEALKQHPSSASTDMAPKGGPQHGSNMEPQPPQNWSNVNPTHAPYGGERTSSKHGTR